MKIYLAGKISSSGEKDWREVLVPALTNAEGETRGGERYLATTSLPMRGGHQYVGPFFVGEDKHGCRLDHRAASACSGVERKQVVTKSFAGIARADLVIAWIGHDFHTAYGAHAELGYAMALNKRYVVIASPNPWGGDEPTLEPFWFLTERAQLIIQNSNPVEAVLGILRLMEEKLH